MAEREKYRARHAHLGPRDRRPRAAGGRKDLESQKEDPFQILISTLLSARTQDATTLDASTRLFARASTPAAVARLRVKQIEKLIYPVGFYRNKAVFVRDAAKMIVAKFGGRVPSTLDELITLPGVGRKTANLGDDPRLQERREHLRGHSRAPHRQPARMGADANAGRDEQELYRTIDRQWWPVINLYLVTWGQNMCRPVYPRCGDCAIVTACRRVNVTRVGKGRVT
jgi:endonuclease-3